MKVKERYSPPKDATWYTGNFAKDVQQLKSKLGIDSGIGLKSNIKSLRQEQIQIARVLAWLFNLRQVWRHHNGTVNNQNDVELAMALLDRTSIPEKCCMRQCHDYCHYGDVEIFALNNLRNCK